MQDDLNKIISNSITINNLNLDVKTIINQLEISLINNKDILNQTSKIDKKNNNGTLLDFDIIDNIFKLIKNETIIYGNVTLLQKDNKKKIIYGKQIMNIGTVAIINDGNPYVIIEMALRNILANNTVIFSNNGYMYGTNKLIIEIFQSVLEQFNISKYLIQMYISEDIEKLLLNFANINLVICIGDHELQQLVLNKSRIPTIISGYENFDLYIEDEVNLNFIKKIIDTKLNINLYINNNVNLDYENAVIVNNIDEVIAQINYNSSKYSSAIFTNSKENASKFIKEVHSKIITINTSPTIERICDISQKDLTIEKTIIYPFSFSLITNSKK